MDKQSHFCARIATMAVLGMVLVGLSGCGSPVDVSDSHSPLSVPPGTACDATDVRMRTCSQGTLCPDGTHQQQICDDVAGRYSDCFCPDGTSPSPDGGVQGDDGNEWCVMMDPVTDTYTNVVGRKFNINPDPQGPAIWTECTVRGTPVACARQTALYDDCSVGQSICTVDGINACDAETGTIVCTMATRVDAWSLDPTLLQPLPSTSEVCTLPGQTPIDEDCDNFPDATVVQGIVIPTHCSHESCYTSLDSDAYGVGNPVDAWNTTVGGIATCASLTPPAQGVYVNLDGDCNDTNAAINPAAREICDAIDNNCVGGIDEMNVCQNFLACNEDKDGDGFGDASDAPVVQMNVASCQPISGIASVPNALDCDDAVSAINPGVDEICDINNDVDENCNGQIDDAEGLACTGGPLTCAAQNGTVCSTGLLGLCSAGTNSCGGNSVLTCVQNTQASTEVTCNGIDEDCDGLTDDTPMGGCGMSCTPGLTCSTGLQGVCSAGLTSCSSNVQSCVQTTQASAEVCNDSVDNDCDGTVNEGCPAPGVFSSTITLAQGTTLVQTNTMLNGFNCNSGPLVIDGTTNFTAVPGTSCTATTVSGTTTITCTGIPVGSVYDVRMCALSGGATNWIHSSHLAPGNVCSLTTVGYANFATQTVSTGTIAATTSCGGRGCCTNHQ